MSKKGSAKNTKNKAKHARLMAQKKNKLANEKIAFKANAIGIIISSLIVWGTTLFAIGLG